MTESGRPPYRADHVGSLLRPEAVHRARAEHERGAISAGELREVEDVAVRELVELQEAIGLESVTDGELRRETWFTDFAYELRGITPTGNTTATVPVEPGGLVALSPGSGARLLTVDGRIGLDRPIFLDDFTTLAGMATTATPKLTIPSPSMVHYRSGRDGISAEIYPDLDEFWSDLVAAYRAEVSALAEAGCTYLQLDDTSLAYVNDPRQREHVRAIGGDPEHQHEVYIRHFNEAIAERPAGLTVTTHLCRGNLRSSWMAEGGYDFVAEALFGELDVDGFFLEYDDERSGGFEPLRFVPKGKRVVLGLVTTKRGELESKDDLKRRIDEAAQFVDLDQLCLSPQCGFASVAEGNDISPDDQTAKLRLVVETAAEVWG